MGGQQAIYSYPKKRLGVKKLKRNQKGFTLIELLVVIAIIGLLASVVLLALNTARAKARDARRLSDLRQISTAAQMIADSDPNAQYPVDAAAFTGSDPLPGGLPTMPTGGSCTGDYTYDTNTGRTQFNVEACLEEGTSEYAAGDVYIDESGTITAGSAPALP